MHSFVRSARNRTGRRRSGSRRRGAVIRPWMRWTGAAALGAVVLVGGSSVVSQLLATRSHLEAAVPLLEEVRAQLADAEPAERAEALKKLEAHTNAARAQTSGVFWWIGEQVPVLGNNLAAVRAAAEVADDVVTEVLAPLSTLSLDDLAPADGRIPVDRVTEVSDLASGSISALERAAGRLKRLNTFGLLPPVESALASIDGPMQRVTAVASGAKPLIDVLPDLLGQQGTREYVIMFQNPAELRALGGIPGASVLLRVSDGRMELVQTAAGWDFAVAPTPLVPLPTDTASLFSDAGGGAPSLGSNYLETTARPDFSYAGRTASAFWTNAFGVTPDAVISVDPIALSYFLGATGPVQLDTGATLSADNVVAQLLNQVYLDNPGLSNDANRAQDAFFAAVVEAVFTRLTSGELDVNAAADAWTKSTDQRRLLLWSADAVEQQAIVDAGLGGLPPQSDGSTNAFGLYLGDAVGSKLDYYLRQHVSVEDKTCDARGTRTIGISAELGNAISDQPDYRDEAFDYITGFWEREGLTQGAIRLRVMLYAPEGADISAVTFGGEPVEYTMHSDGGVPVAYVVVTVQPGETKTLAFDATLRRSATKQTSVDVTPTVVPSDVEYSRVMCK